ncbi:hypothetical protein [Kitasatospora sp. NPDC088548]|uniref:hypothetical protein n=1 Tax=Kitasatospora sp. NPDC088548 TaxID=3364075 RepID=UPI003802D3BC
MSQGLNFRGQWDGPNPFGESFEITLSRREWEQALAVSRHLQAHERAEYLAKGLKLNEPPGSYVPDPLGHWVLAIRSLEAALATLGDPVTASVNRYEAYALCGCPTITSAPVPGHPADANGVTRRGYEPPIIPQAQRNRLERWLFEWGEWERAANAAAD